MHLSTMVETAAADLRRRAKQTRLPFSTHKIVETAFPDALVTGRNLPSGVLEAVARTGSGPVILYARDQPIPMQRLSIAHALGHLLFDGEAAFRQPGQRRNPAVEERADWFAEELLAPYDRVRRHVTRLPRSEHDDVYLDMVDRIASRFVVPAKVIDRVIRARIRQVIKHA